MFIGECSHRRNDRCLSTATTSSGMYRDFFPVRRKVIKNNRGVPERSELQSPSPVCMFYFAHPFGGIATPSTVAYSIDPFVDIPAKAQNASLTKSKNPSWCHKSTSFPLSPTTTTQSHGVEAHGPRTLAASEHDQFTQSLIRTLQQRFGKSAFQVHKLLRDFN